MGKTGEQLQVLSKDKTREASSGLTIHLLFIQNLVVQRINDVMGIANGTPLTLVRLESSHKNPDWLSSNPLMH